MRNLTIIGVMLGTCGFSSGGILNHKEFDCLAADFSGNNGGAVWSSAWTDSGNPSVVSAAGGTATTISPRYLNYQFPATLGYTFSMRDSPGATTKTVDRPLTTPPLKRFFRLKISKS